MLKKLLYTPARKIVCLLVGFKAWSYQFSGKIRAKYYKLAMAECGSGLVIFGKPLIFHPQKIHMGSHVTINNGCQISPRADIYISDYVTMSRGSQITAGTLDMNHWSNERYKEHVHTQGEVFLGEGTWLCVNSIVLPGVHITGKGVVVAAGSIVTHDITEDYVVVAGSPAKIVKKLG